MKKKSGFSVILLQTGLLLVGLFFLNLIGGALYKRIDLTEDSRYTVSDSAAAMVRALPKEAFITVYFGGAMPAYYKNLEEDIRLYLEELASQSDGKLDFQFHDPTGDTATFNRFARQGIPPFPLSAPLSSTQKQDILVLPYAEINYDGRMSIVELIKGCVFRDQRGRLDIDVTKARSNIEYNLLTELYNLSREKYKTIGLMTGHGEFPKEAMADLYKELDAYYNLIQVNLRNGRPLTPDDLDVLFVLQPQTGFSEREKFELDQYLLRGGRIVFCMDQQVLDFTIGEQASTLTALRGTNLDDMFISKGVKLNYDLVEDMTCGNIDAATYSGTWGSNFRAKPWPFFPVLFQFPNSPLTRNLKDVMIRYGSSIDTFFTPGVKKSVLLTSSPFTRVRNGVQFINIQQELERKADRRDFKGGERIFSVLIEGQWNSQFENRPVPRDSAAPDGPKLPVLTTMLPGAKPKIALISDGEFATGELVQGKLMGLPSDNRDFMINLIDHFTGQEIRSSLRERDIIPRRLNFNNYKESLSFYQIVNVGAPVALILLYGIIRAWRRKVRNQSKRTS